MMFKRYIIQSNTKVKSKDCLTAIGEAGIQITEIVIINCTKVNNLGPTDEFRYYDLFSTLDIPETEFTVSLNAWSKPRRFKITQTDDPPVEPRSLETYNLINDKVHPLSITTGVTLHYPTVPEDPDTIVVNYAFGYKDKNNCAYLIDCLKDLVEQVIQDL